VTYLVDFLISFNSYPTLLVVLVAVVAIAALLVAIAIRSHFFGRKHF
jgi:hypothetical protein